LLVICALLRPAWPNASGIFSYMMIIDITQSMNTPDQRDQHKAISRLEAVKRSVRQTLVDLPCGSRAGFAVFTEYRPFALFAPIEVCANFAELTGALARIDGRMAWAGASEVAKGVNFALRMDKDLVDHPSLIFFTDGHEAPPVDPRYRIRFDARSPDISGSIVGVGADQLSRIPKVAPDGRALGYWSAGDVLHDDPHNLGRGGSVAGESTVDEQGRSEVKKIHGSEHLSSLREVYLRQLAQEAGLGYVRLIDPVQTSRALRSVKPNAVARGSVPLHWLPAGAALLLLLTSLLAALLPRRLPRP
jgi:mxaL protein